MKTMTRRTFFTRGVVGGAIGAAALGVQAADATPPSEASWHWIKVHPAERAINAHHYSSAITAQRSDGTYFSVVWSLAAAPTARDVNLSLARAFSELETFRKCRCHVGKPCDHHQYSG